MTRSSWTNFLNSMPTEHHHQQVHHPTRQDDDGNKVQPLQAGRVETNTLIDKDKISRNIKAISILLLLISLIAEDNFSEIFPFIIGTFSVVVIYLKFKEWNPLKIIEFIRTWFRLALDAEIDWEKLGTGLFLLLFTGFLIIEELPMTMKLLYLTWAFSFFWDIFCHFGKMPDNLTIKERFIAFFHIEDPNVLAKLYHQIYLTQCSPKRRSPNIGRNKSLVLDPKPKKGKIINIQFDRSEISSKRFYCTANLEGLQEIETLK